MVESSLKLINIHSENTQKGNPSLGYRPLAPKALIPEDKNRENMSHFVT